MLTSPPQGETLAQLIDHETRYYAHLATVEKTPFAWFLHSQESPDCQDINRALHLRDDGRGPDAIAREVLAYYRARGLPPVAEVDAVAEAQGIGAALRRLGLMPVMDAWLLMRYAPSSPLPQPAEGIEVVMPTTESEVRAWIEAALSPDVGTEEEAVWRNVTEREARCPAFQRYLGRLDGAPAGTCALFRADGWSRIEEVATRPEFRRRGVASAVVAQAIADSHAQGDAVIFLFTAEGGDGERVYRRLGFVSWGVNVLHRHLAR